MDYHSWGQDLRQVSRLGLGLAALGRPGYINLGHAEDMTEGYAVAEMQQRAFEVLDVAREQGVTYYDAARSYGRAEEFLANWLTSRAVPADQVVIGSKWGYTYTADWQVAAAAHEVKEHSWEKLDEQWQQSRNWLGEQLDLYQIHSATLESGVLNNSAVLQRLEELKAQGVLIGLSVSGPQQAAVIEQAVSLQVSGVRLFDAVQATWNLLERSAGLALQQAHAAGMKVIIKEALANGRLTSRNQAADFANSRRLLEQTAAGLGTSLDALAIAGVLANSWVDVVLSGASTAAQLHSNLQALTVEYTPETAAQLQPLVEPAAAYWKTRSQLEWN